MLVIWMKLNSFENKIYFSKILDKNERIDVDIVNYVPVHYQWSKGTTVKRG